MSGLLVALAHLFAEWQIKGSQVARISEANVFFVLVAIVSDWRLLLYSVLGPLSLIVSQLAFIIQIVVVGVLRIITLFKSEPMCRHGLLHVS